jgi:hypothetical protein
MLRIILFCFMFYASIAQDILNRTKSFQFLYAIMVTAVFFQCTSQVWMRVSHLNGTTEVLCLVFMTPVFELPEFTA